jgi:ABC-type nitrate/sulfonate/bicarbonate transport system substrate-binding protein
MRSGQSRLVLAGSAVVALLALTACAPAPTPPGASSGSAPGSSGTTAGAASSGVASAQAAGAGPVAAPAPASDPGGFALAPPVRLRVAYTAPSGGYLPLYVAQDAGLLRKRGLESELILTSGGVQAVQALVAGEVDVVIADGANFVQAGLQGGETVIFAVSTNTFATSLVVHPSIKSPEDLRGRRLGTGRVGASTDIAARYLLRLWGLIPGTDVTLVQTGSQQELLLALTTDVVDGGVTSDPALWQAIKEGFVQMADLGTLGAQYATWSVGAMKSTLRERPDVLRAFTVAYVDGIAWTNRHRAESLDILAKYTGAGDREVLGLTYDRWTSTYWARTPYPTAGGIQAVLDNVSLEDPRAAQASPADFFDDRFVRELDESGYIRRLYE